MIKMGGGVYLELHDDGSISSDRFLCPFEVLDLKVWVANVAVTSGVLVCTQLQLCCACCMV